jgi:hypothetical protein
LIRKSVQSLWKTSVADVVRFDGDRRQRALEQAVIARLEDSLETAVLHYQDALLVTYENTLPKHVTPPKKWLKYE